MVTRLREHRSVRKIEAAGQALGEVRYELTGPARRHADDPGRCRIGPPHVLDEGRSRLDKLVVEALAGLPVPTDKPSPAGISVQRESATLLEPLIRLDRAAPSSD